VVLVWKLDRLSRSLKDLLHIMEKISEADGGFRTLTDHIDTTTPAGRMMQKVGAFAEFLRAMISERTLAADGRGGWPIPARSGHPIDISRAHGVSLSEPGSRQPHQFRRIRIAPLTLAPRHGQWVTIARSAWGAEASARAETGVRRVGGK
jgi:hypothetical protein